MTSGTLFSVAAVLAYMLPACLATDPLTNVARCTATVTATTQGSSEDAYVELGASAAVKVCGGEAEDTVHLEVKAIASAFAQAMVEVSGDCETSGDAQGRAVATGVAKKTARAVATAVGRALATAESCQSCTAAAEAFVAVCEEVLVSVVAEAEVEVSAVSQSGGTDQDSKRDLVERMEEKSIDALAEVFAEARVNYDGTCSAEVGIIALAGETEAICEAFATGEVTQISTNASANAGVIASAQACNADGDASVEAKVESIATALAQAVAGALTEADVICDTNGDESVGCAEASAQVDAVARAQAEAFASAFVEAESCNCDVSSHITASVLTPILVEASAEAYAHVCASGDGAIAEVNSFAEVYVKESVEAIAEAIGKVAAGDGCFVDATATAEVKDQSFECDECVSRKCAGKGVEGVKPCCDTNKHCVKISDRTSRCRNKDLDLKGKEVQQCTAKVPEP